MPDIGWSELLVIGIVALIVVGPRDLPVMFKRLGEFTGKAKRMAREFQRAMDDAARETGVSDTATDLRKFANPRKMGMDAIEDATKDLKAWEPDETTGPATKELSEERKAQRDAISKKSAELALKRQERERAAAEAAESEETVLLPDPEAAAPAEAPKAAAKPKGAAKPKAKAKPRKKPAAKKDDAPEADA